MDPRPFANNRKRFKPSGELAQPKASVGIFAFCADTEEKAARMQAVMDYRLISISKGQTDEAPAYGSVRNYPYTDEESRQVKFNRQRMIVGTRDVVKEKMIALAHDHNVNEIIVATFAETSHDRLRSYELLAEIFDLKNEDSLPDKKKETFTKTTTQ